MRFALEHRDERTTLLLAGELDCASAAVAHLALERAGHDAIEIVLDLSRVIFLDAAGLRFLISAQRRARAADRRLIVRRPSRSVRRMIDLTGASPLLSIEDPEYGHLDGRVDGALTRILDTALDSALRTTQADAASAQLADPTSGALWLVAQRGLTSPILDYFEIVGEDESICGAGLRTSRPVWIPELARSPILADTPALDVLLDAGVRALASVPVQAPDGRLLAVLSVHHRLVTHWTRPQMAGLEQLGRSVAKHCRSAYRSTPTLTSRTAVSPLPRLRRRNVSWFRAALPGPARPTCDRPPCRRRRLAAPPPLEAVRFLSPAPSAGTKCDHPHRSRPYRTDRGLPRARFG